MEKSPYLKENDPRGELLYNVINNNQSIKEDYFEEEENQTLEYLFNTTMECLPENSIDIKISLLKRLKNENLNLYDFFDIVECYFNKYYYDIDLTDEAKEKLKKYF